MLCCDWIYIFTVESDFIREPFPMSRTIPILLITGGSLVNCNEATTATYLGYLVLPALSTFLFLVSLVNEDGIMMLARACIFFLVAIHSISQNTHEITPTESC